MSKNRTVVTGVSIVFAFALCMVSRSAWADVVILNVNSAQSSLMLGGTAFGLNYVQQNAGSLVTTLSGTIRADLTAGVFTFSAGSAIVADINPNGPYTTAPNPIGVEPGNFGVTASGVVPGFGDATVNGVYKNLVFDVTSGTTQNGVALTGATLRFTAGTLDFGAATGLGPQVGSSNLANVAGANTSAALVTWDGTTLTLPVVFQTLGSNRVENWSGTISATAVPEPSTISLLFSFGFVASMRCRRRRPLLAAEASPVVLPVK